MHDVNEVETIAFGGVAWEDRSGDKPRFIAMDGADKFYISQYNDNGSCHGRWHWKRAFYVIEKADPSGAIENHMSGIVDTREEAMLACIDAKNRLPQIIRILARELGIETAYEQGYLDAKAEMKAVIAQL